jgi:phosphoribosyl 1,2-cyclic phosphate phosphodiesterase
VDYSPDTVLQIQRSGRDLRELTTLIFTHAHNDHFAPYELLYREANHVRMGGLPLLHVYGSAGVMDRLRDALEDAPHTTIEFEPPLEPFVERTAKDGTVILPLPAQHTGDPLLLKITRNGRSLFYGHDTGLLPEETIRALAGAPLDVALLDCTYGDAEFTGPGHMGIDDVLDTVKRLRGAGAAGPATQIVATHFSHNGGLMHAELEARFAGTGVQVAYDSMILKA